MANQRRRRNLGPRTNQNINLTQLVAALNRNAQPKRQPKRRQQPNQNKKIDQRISQLTQVVTKLAISNAPKPTNLYHFFRSEGESVPSMPHPPDLETDLRLRASQNGIAKMSSDVRAAFVSGAGEFTGTPDGKVAYHLIFIPLRAADIKPSAVDEKTN
ncbi:hypothetical protein [Guangdong red-banded snake torovirus]|uniref:Uncharacterized protein n=1 Tax=Guangdong red-banded snake-Lycodon rufozonatus-torovirus LPSF30546 TaxID=2847099 RepID=A0A2P1GN07_9NIDO|nr:hypothetical protein [Guangdong red-banded snake torovirus]AVM87350.1 hypothetical protein [Guangdong red-banded snake-Lycodon rufozonatus-torovirus LPSF30546]